MFLRHQNKSAIEDERPGLHRQALNGLYYPIDAGAVLTFLALMEQDSLIWIDIPPVSAFFSTY